MCVSEKEHAAPWPLVQVFVALVLKWGGFCVEQQTRLNQCVWAVLLLQCCPQGTDNVGSLSGVPLDSWIQPEKRNLIYTDREENQNSGTRALIYTWKATRRKSGIVEGWKKDILLLENVTEESRKGKEEWNWNFVKKKKRPRRGNWVAPRRDGSPKYLWEPCPWLGAAQITQWMETAWALVLQLYRQPG